MFSTLRKFTALLVLLGEAVVLKKRAKPTVWASVAVMVMGGVIAGATDLTMSVPGYFCVAVCCCATAMYLVLIVRVGKRAGLDSFSLLYYNNVLSLPLMLTYLAMFTTELREVPMYPRIREPRFWSFLLFSAAQATVLNLAIFLCTNVNSPLATTVTGQVKDLVTISVGLFFFGDVKLSAPNLFGLGLSLVGSLLYSLVKLIAAKKASKENLR